MVINTNFAANCKQLERAWETYTNWFRKYSIKFALEKSELLYFSRAYKACLLLVCFNNTIVSPVDSARFLGVWLNRKLSWRAHIAKVKGKIMTQMFAFSKLAALA
jgi:hypothetical protein